MSVVELEEDGLGAAEVVDVAGLKAEFLVEFVKVRWEDCVFLNRWPACHLVVVEVGLKRQAKGETWERNSASVALRSSIMLSID